MKRKCDLKEAEAVNLRKENGDIKEEVKKKEAENVQIEVRTQREGYWPRASGSLVREAFLTHVVSSTG